MLLICVVVNGISCSLFVSWFMIFFFLAKTMSGGAGVGVGIPDNQCGGRNA